MTRKRDEILDHEADGIREFDNDLPRWWLYGFYFTILLGAVYLLNYHVLPEPLVGPASIQAEYAADVAAAEAGRPAAPPAPTSAGGGAPAVAVALLTDAEDLEEGEEIYASATHPCAACHKPDLGGLVGPNLTDDQWLHGCAVADVVNAVKVGFPLQGMLPYGGGSALTDQQVLQLASYILSKRGSNPAGAKAADPARDKPCP
jgi:cytochrome c oxidase cbb3-type subunit 3